MTGDALRDVSNASFVQASHFASPNADSAPGGKKQVRSPWTAPREKKKGRPAPCLVNNESAASPTEYSPVGTQRSTLKLR